MTPTQFIQHIRVLVSEGKFEKALDALRNFLANSPKLNEAIQQSARYKHVKKQIRTGTIRHQDATVDINQISGGILDLLSELENNAADTNTSDKTQEIVFGYLRDKTGIPKDLPQNLADNLITSSNLWVKNIRQSLMRENVEVGSTPSSIYKHYGWLIECFLHKMDVKIIKDDHLYRLSLMAEVFQSSLRYLCYIQFAQLWSKSENSSLQYFLQLDQQSCKNYDFLSGLLQATQALDKEQSFVPEIHQFTEKLSNRESSLYRSALFLEQKRTDLLLNQIAVDEKLPHLLEEYITALVYWLRHIAFLANYRLVSIKDINLSYRLGTAKNFIHLYGELHGRYSEHALDRKDFVAYSVEDVFTYNQSVLLFKGDHVKTCLSNIHQADNYISLSPLIIDRSVYLEKETQTPEIYYYAGCSKVSYAFDLYLNELAYGGKASKNSNQSFAVEEINDDSPKLDDLFLQMENIFNPIIPQAS